MPSKRLTNQQRASRLQKGGSENLNWHLERAQKPGPAEGNLNQKFIIPTLHITYLQNSHSPHINCFQIEKYLMFENVSKFKMCMDRCPSSNLKFRHFPYFACSRNLALPFNAFLYST
jgi:hypothetical protein